MKEIAKSESARTRLVINSKNHSKLINKNMIGGWENEGKFENPSLKIEERELRGGWFFIIIIIIFNVKGRVEFGFIVFG